MSSDSKKILIATSGGDCPGLNAVLRAFVKSATNEPGWEVWGSRQSFNGLLGIPQELIRLDRKTVSGIHVKGGTILGTTKESGPFNWPVKRADGTTEYVDRSDEFVRICQFAGFSAIVNIGGDGSQRMTLALHKKGLPVIGIPKTIDNDLEATDVTFGFQSAVDVATEAVDRLVSTAESHNRIQILELMGKHSGWITLHAAIAGGAEVCLIPEIPYDITKISAFLRRRFDGGKRFAVIAVAEGAIPLGAGPAEARGVKAHPNISIKLSGAAERFAGELKNAGFEGIRCTILGHVQRGGTPVPFDRILGAQYGIKAFEMVKNGEFGRMASCQNGQMTSVPLEEATRSLKRVPLDGALIQTARNINICFGD
ncbi:MAG: ATP-dependent 6-phosphofructokinase [Puniceicoccales bacterium]|jgi:6-phosphofructokinase 1|nr:ATP-dependent 6-phosphofructokinase [Puniceicoccales bacterium]